jgi:hypothetical protein
MIAPRIQLDLSSFLPRAGGDSEFLGLGVAVDIQAGRQPKKFERKENAHV